MSLAPAAPPDLDSLVASAQAAEREGRWAAARALYEQALREPPDDAPAGLASSLLRWIAQTHLAEGSLEAALDLGAAALAAAEAAGDRTAAARAKNSLGNVHQAIGNLDEADRLYALALAEAAALGDTLLAAAAEQNAGIIANIRGDYRAALRHYRASLATHRTLGTSAYVAHALNNLGMLCTDLRRYRAAERAFAEAMDVCAEVGDAATRARIAGNRIEPWVARRRWTEARAACDRALRLAEAAGETATRGEIRRHQGVIARETGDAAAAAAFLAEAAEIADARGDLLLGAETAREQAVLHLRRNEPRETLQALNRAHDRFSRLQARRDVADVAARLHGLEAQFLEIVSHWAQSIESADHYTRGHCERVANYACALARAAGVDPAVLLWFRMGALLHDVGKIVVPPEVLNKAGALTPDERALMERHPDAGVELIGDVEFPWDITPMVRHHHEAWDGSGYPAGLSGEAIPLPARILCVADVYDALSTDRPYRRAFSHGQTLEIMSREAGSRLDPALFALFRGLDLDSTALAA